MVAIWDSGLLAPNRAPGRGLVHATIRTLTVSCLRHRCSFYSVISETPTPDATYLENVNQNKATPLSSVESTRDDEFQVVTCSRSCIVAGSWVVGCDEAVNEEAMRRMRPPGSEEDEAAWKICDVRLSSESWILAT